MNYFFNIHTPQLYFMISLEIIFSPRHQLLLPTRNQILAVRPDLCVNSPTKKKKNLSETETYSYKNRYYLHKSSKLKKSSCELFQL